MIKEPGTAMSHKTIKYEYTDIEEALMRCYEFRILYKEENIYESHSIKVGKKKIVVMFTLSNGTNNKSNKR